MDDAVERLLYPRGRPKGHQVYVWFAKKIPKDVRDCIDQRLDLVHIQGDPWAWPAHCDFYVVRSALNWQSEKAAAAMGAQIVVLPEGADYLRQKVSELIEERDVYIFRAARIGDRP
jgi:uncharacterized Fe-S cluster protein YjdI